MHDLEVRQMALCEGASNFPLHSESSYTDAV